ncbi:flavodoxin [Desulfovibrio sp.]|uniref:flavodoxin n=1 Tax=Desulfovibrio sp. TaxID=885 RepID=UPI0023D79EAA|nr:flavodoxin [Desulfovibrio sp.]MDE7241663.1 NAD(P)H-dependent oxidoreductase [Desulfovibrio sp.]
MTKILVAYFSATGTTARVAHALAETAGADLYAITPAVPYTAADLNWHDKKSRSSLEMADAASRPAIAGELPDAAAYDAVFVGFPIWWYQAPRIIETFIQARDFSGKTLIPFATSGGSPLGESGAILEKLCPGGRWLAGRRLNAGVTERELRDWLKQLGLGEGR